MDTKPTEKLPSHRPQPKTIETRSTFPDDVVEEILSWLSVRRLLRFRCVSKSWFALINCPRFIKKQHEKQYAIFKEEGDVPLFFNTRHWASNFGDPNQFYLLSKRSGDVPLCVTSDLERDGSPYSPRNLELLRTLRLVGFVNGVALLAWDYLGAWNAYFALWNPATREFQVVRPRRPCSQRKRHADMYSLDNATWKSIKDPHPHIKIVERVYACDGHFNGAYYWSCQKRDNNKSYLSLSFDFSSEVLKVHDPPVARGLPVLLHRQIYGLTSIVL
ncbi:hypothetical protein Cgig2_015596 [Carnegiea gigantea]|uniref:F-box domain-containing protein n=1 Tax=Carnegiea gigantea TaxID=171969 RepID=A0A9Q1GZ88_9CARY|nr:hypothetical protein Cgig2_015596 [Carnegiea gigantea]